MTEYIETCHKYLADHVDFDGSFKSIVEVKTKSIINACGTKPDLQNDSFLVLGQNVIQLGLIGLGVKPVVIDSENSHKIKHDGAIHYEGELADFVAQERTFDWVIGADEWLTYAATEDEQKQKLSCISKITNKGFFTTIKDYKNMYSNQRYFEEPFVLRTEKGDIIVIRKRTWDNQDRQAWDNVNYIIHNDDLKICTPWRRRTMYFKQLAKFVTDLGATQFTVEKNQMYKPIFSKSLEYVIVVKFN